MEATEQFAEAREIIVKLIQLYPENQSLLNMAARFYSGQGDLATGESYWRKSFALNACDYATVQGLLEVLLAENKADEAREICFDPRLSQEQQADCLVEAGSWFLDRGRFGEAEPWLREGISLDEANESAHVKLSIALYRGQKLAEAQAAVEKARQFFPESRAVLYWYGDIMSEAVSTMAKALEAYRKLYELDQDVEMKAMAMSMQGYCLLVSGQKEEAVQAFEHALELNILQPIAATNLAAMRAEQGDLTGALKILQPVVDAGKGPEAQTLMTDFLNLTLIFNLPVKQEWLDQAVERLEDIRVNNNGKIGEENTLLWQITGLALELGDTDLVRQIHRGKRLL